MSLLPHLRQSIMTPVLILLVGLLAPGCDSGEDASAADPTGKADAEMLDVLESLASLNPRPIETLTPAEARANPTVADAVRALLVARGQSTAPEPVGTVEDRTIPAPGVPPVPVRVYTPAGTAPAGGWPVTVYYHGGGWVIATIDTYDSSARALTNAAQTVVVSVEYRKGPENPFPAAHDDAYAAYRFVVDNTASFGGNPAKIAVAGESAGGNLAANVALQAKADGIRQPLHQLLVYPVASNDLNTESELEYVEANPLDRPAVEYFVRNYIPNEAQRADPRINLVGRTDFAGVAPATIISAEIDPLLTDGENLEAVLEAAGVDVVRYYFDGTSHEFFGTGAVVADAREAVAQSAARLRAAFGT